MKNYYISLVVNIFYWRYGKEESRESIVCLPDCKRILCKSVMQVVTHVFFLMFPFLRVQWDLDLRVRVDINRRIFWNIARLIYIIIQTYRKLCLKFFNPFNSAINLAFDLKVLVAFASYVCRGQIFENVGTNSS